MLTSAGTKYRRANVPIIPMVNVFVFFRQHLKVCCHVIDLTNLKNDGMGGLFGPNGALFVLDRGAQTTGRSGKGIKEICRVVV